MKTLATILGVLASLAIGCSSEGPTEERSATTSSMERKADSCPRNYEACGEKGDLCCPVAPQKTSCPNNYETCGEKGELCCPVAPSDEATCPAGYETCGEKGELCCPT